MSNQTTPTNPTQLPPDLAAQIEADAKKYVEETRGRAGRVETYIAGASAYVGKMNETQLPDEVTNKIHADAEKLYNELDEKARERDSYDFGLPMVTKIKKPIVKLLTAYATKLHKAQQEIQQATAIIQKLAFRYNGTINRELLNEIKTFLDGK